VILKHSDVKSWPWNERSQSTKQGLRFPHQ
jgi:hypothetical protein